MAARAPGRNPDHISTSRAWAACLLLCAAVPMAGFAQSPNARIPEVPDAGRSLREIESTQPEFAPLPDQAPLDDSAARPAPAPSGDPDGGARLHVRAFRLQGNLHVDTDALQAQLADLNGSEQDLAGLRAAADRITRYYHDQGYLLARAYLPPQEIRDGVVDIAVQEGVYDEIQLDNRSRVSDAVLRRGLSVLRPGDPVHIDNLESRLLRLSDLPGAAVQGTLRAGAHPGSSTLLVNAAPTPLVTGSIDADNFGGYYTGEYRLGGSLDVNSPLRLGDQLSLRLLTSDRKQRYYYAAYQAPVGPALTRLGLNVSNMRYALGRDFEILEAHGSARTTGIFMQQPLITGRHFRLEARLQYEDRQLRDDIDMFSQRHAKRIRLGTASLSANGEDSLFGGGRSAAYISYSHGSLRLETEAQRIRDRALNRSAGGFGKLNLTLLRLQHLYGPFTLYGQISAQRATKNLDSSEQFSLGGPYGVRAYANGSSSGDSGWQASLELRYVPMAGLQFAAFADAGRVRLSQLPWTDERNQRRLSAAGLSITQAGPSHQVMAAMAWPIQRENEQNGPKQEPRFWLRATRYF